MLESLSSKAIYTKVKAMYGRMLTMADYEQLMHKSSVPACAAWLKAQPAYAGVLRDVQETQIHRGALEALLGRAAFEQYLRLAHYTGKTARFISSYFLARMEVRCIIDRVRLFQSANPNEFIQSVPGYLVGRLSFDVLALGAARSFPDLLAGLRHTRYYKALAALRPRESGEIPLPVVEHALYRQYYDDLFVLIDKTFSGETAKDLRTIFTTQAQLSDIRTAYRLKRFFGGRPEEIEPLLLLYRGRLTRRAIADIVQAPDADAMLELLARGRYGRYFDRDHFVFIENGTGNIRLGLAKKFLTFSTSPVTAALAFMILREIETDNLITVIEGVRYQLDIANIRPLLIQGGIGA